MTRKDIFDAISLETGIPVEKLPRRFEILGKAIIMSLKGLSDETKVKIARAYVSKLKLWSFYEIIEIRGIMRIPSVRLLYGINTDVLHFENGIAYRLNPSRVMFSKGNKYERHRLVDLVDENETIVDMFAGIGYYSLPISLRAYVVYACEINLDSFHYLLLNKRINNSKRLIPYYGDSLSFPLKNIADRIIMGHFDSISYLGKALDILKDRGIIHLHALSKRGDDTTYNYLRSLEFVKDVRQRLVKSYSPSTDHLVFDLEIEKK